MSPTPELIFVYNANSGALNALKDGLHKVISPETYNCSLCKLTHGSFGELAPWSAFKKSYSGTLSFYHKDQFQKLFRSKWLPKYEFPVVLYNYNEELGLLLSGEELNKCETLDELLAKLKKQLAHPNYPWAVI